MQSFTNETLHVTSNSVEHKFNREFKIIIITINVNIKLINYYLDIVLLFIYGYTTYIERIHIHCIFIHCNSDIM